METKFNNFQNLYEVRKVIRFELKPTKTTERFLQEKEWFYGEGKIPQNIFYRNKQLEKGTNYSSELIKKIDENQFIGMSQEILNCLFKLRGILNANFGSEIFVKREIFNLINKQFFIKIKKKLSGGRSVSFLEIKNNLKDFGNGLEKIMTYFDELLKNIENLQIDLKNLLNSNINNSKTDIKKILRNISLEYIRVENFLSNFGLNEVKFHGKTKESIEKILNQEDFFNQARNSYFISENQSSGILVRRFGFNEKSLNRRQLEEIKNELVKLKSDFKNKEKEKLDLELRRQKDIEIYELEIKQKRFPDLLYPESWEKIGEDEKNKQFYELKKIRNDDENIKKITNELNQIKKDYGNLKVKINNKEKDLENNLALTHYAKLLKKEQSGEDFYYLVLIKVDNKNILKESLSNLESNNIVKILEYNTLTFGAFVKLSLSYDGTIGGYFDKNKNKFILTNKPEEKDLKDFLEYKKCENENKNVDWFYKKKFNDKFKNYQKSPFEKLKKYIENIILNNEKIFGNIKFDFQKLGKITDLNQYIIEFNKQGYNVKWEKIDFEKIRELEKEEKLEIYQIYCKDFYRDPEFFHEGAFKDDKSYSIDDQKQEKINRLRDISSKGNKNLFTIYWQDFINNIGDINKDIRLNSDSGYFIKPKEDYINDNIKGKSRKKRTKIIGTFNLSFNSNNLNKDLVTFNEIYKQKIKPIKEELSYIGFDRGEKELLTYCVLDKNGNCINENGKYLIGNFNLINSKGEFITEEDCFYKSSKEKYEKKHDLLSGLPDFSNPQNIDNKKETDGKLYFFKLNHCAKFYLTNEGFCILDKHGEELVLQDENGNKVYNYYLIFQAEVYKRRILNKKGDIKLEDIQSFRGGYISQIIKVLNEWILKYNCVLVLENLGRKQEKLTRKGFESNKEEIINITFGATIYQEIETLLNRKYNYFQEKEENKVLQLTPKVRNIGEIKNIEKSQLDLNLGNIIFIDETNTSKECPNCKELLIRKKTKTTDNVYHDNTKSNNGCKFSTKNGDKYGFDFINSGDDLAAYNIAKRGKYYLENLIN